MDCLTCLNLSRERRISPGPFIYEGTHWIVDHAYPTTHLGWLVILPKRHVEALHELTGNCPQTSTVFALEPAHLPPILHIGTKVPGKAAPHLVYSS